MLTAFVLLSFAVDAPAGIERSLAALALGLRALGHRAAIITATPSAAVPGVDIIQLRALRLESPMTEDALLDAVDGTGVVAEVDEVIRRLRPDVVCWADATWGLGFAGDPCGARSVLMMHVMRSDELFEQALDRGPDRVVVPSEFVLDQAGRHGYDLAGWRVVRNGLLPGRAHELPADLERRRLEGPVRLISRLEPQKGVEEFLAAYPREWQRPVDVVLAAAGFEYYTGMQASVAEGILKAVGDRPDIRIRPALAWREVQPFMSGAAVCAIPSVEAESFGLVALEAMSVGTPVCGYGLGNLPALVGDAGLLLPPSPGPSMLWHGIDGMLRDPASYARRCAAAVGRSREYTAERAARAFLEAAEQ